MYPVLKIIRVINIRRMRCCSSCGTYGGEERCILGFGGENWETYHFEDLGINKRLLLKVVFGKENG